MRTIYLHLTKKNQIMIFSEIPGNSQVKKQLVRSFKNNKTSHAQMFLGNRGSGKLALALAYAQFLNCENKLEHDSCEICNSCIKYKKLIHPDLHLVFPVAKTSKIKNPISDNFINQWRNLVLQNPYISLNQWIEHITDKHKNLEGTIYKDEAVAIHKKLTFKNHEALYRIILIWLPEKMNIETSNKLLKDLEEPPKKTIFLLVSEDARTLLETIKSRLQLIKIPNFSKEEILKQPKEGKSDLFEKFSVWMRFVYKINIQQISNWTEEISSMDRKDQKNICSYSIRIIRECMIYNFASKSLLNLEEKELDFVKKFSRFIHEENTISIIEKLEETIKALNRNGNPKILFFELSLQMIKLLKLKRKFVIKEK